MSWVKPNFLWMMYRSGWATKENCGAFVVALAFAGALVMGFMPTYEIRFDDTSPGANIYCLTAEEAEAAVRNIYPDAIITDYERVEDEREMAVFCASIQKPEQTGVIYHLL